MAPIEFHIREKKNTMGVNGYTVNCLVINIIFLCVQQKEEIHTGLKQLEGE